MFNVQDLFNGQLVGVEKSTALLQAIPVGIAKLRYQCVQTNDSLNTLITIVALENHSKREIAQACSQAQEMLGEFEQAVESLRRASAAVDYAHLDSVVVLEVMIQHLRNGFDALIARIYSA